MTGDGQIGRQASKHAIQLTVQPSAQPSPSLPSGKRSKITTATWNLRRVPTDVGALQEAHPCSPNREPAGLAGLTLYYLGTTLYLRQTTSIHLGHYIRALLASKVLQDSEP